jgi:hypothetical protein
MLMVLLDTQGGAVADPGLIYQAPSEQKSWLDKHRLQTHLTAKSKSILTQIRQLSDIL